MSLHHDLITNYQRHLRAHNTPPAVTERSLDHLHAFIRWLHPTHPLEATPEQIEAYLIDRIDRGHSRASVCRTVSTLNRLYQELDRPRLRLTLPTVERRLPELPPPETIARLLAALTEPRHRLVVRLLYSTGLRAGELTRLNTGDLDPRERALVIHTRPPGARRVPLGAGLHRRLLEERRGRGAGEPLIPMRGRGRWTPGDLRDLLRRASERAGLPDVVTSRSLRRAFAEDLTRAGLDRASVHARLGYSSGKSGRHRGLPAFLSAVRS